MNRETNWLLDYADSEFIKAEKRLNRAARLRDYIRALVVSQRNLEGQMAIVLKARSGDDE